MKFAAASLTAIVAYFATGSVANAAAINNQAQAMADQGGFAESCKDFAIHTREISHGTYFDIDAKCAATNDRELNTRLQLSLCMANDAGVMKWSKRGKFDKSCNGCTIKHVSKKEVKMGCWCDPVVRKTLRYTEINLNDGIRNEGGHTWCGDEIGTAW